jgi:hypothetical protein
MYRVEGRLDKMVDAYGYVNGKLIYNIWFISQSFYQYSR